MNTFHGSSIFTLEEHAMRESIIRDEIDFISRNLDSGNYIEDYKVFLADLETLENYMVNYGDVRLFELWLKMKKWDKEN